MRKLIYDDLFAIQLADLEQHVPQIRKATHRREFCLFARTENR